MELNVLLVSLLPMDEELFTEKGLVRDIKLFEKALDSSKERNDEYSIKVYINDHVNGYMAGVISRKSNVKLHDRNFEIHNEDDFPPVVWLWDRSEQVILVENKTSVFSSANVAAKAFSNISNNLTLAEHGFRAHVHPKTVESAFWETFESFEYVSEVKFNLAAPNLFGSTKKEIGDFLHEVVEETNASEFSPVFKNPDGNLNLKPSSWLNAMIDWVKDGAGTWNIRGKRSYKDKYKNIGSKTRAKLLLIDGNITELELENYKPQDIAEIVEMIRDRYTFKK
ncbi:hypothetical protein HWQ46_10350 [Shewanella sp. D64]|uniref:hypothetical protein n=1 Tax=unclassified Shewanella TaxID=196818 RepID=UPI0022BA623A|nr:MULTISPECIES: hypothetical protein [unclassified Shewanella]MEC4725946.1 hypothetical protein [Shewanella sp. D64]MEC4737201.1 hypothetical protein [Shewanella sp. E94]WBJ93580.1 hypothetical protein HWQ47_16800 [Shewanella sp. MTB7]